MRRRRPQGGRRTSFPVVPGLTRHPYAAAVVVRTVSAAATYRWITRYGSLRSQGRRGGITAHPFKFQTAQIIPQRQAPEDLPENLTLRIQRAQGRPGARRTRGLVRNVAKECCARAYRFGGGIRPSLRNGFTAYT